IDATAEDRRPGQRTLLRGRDAVLAARDGWTAVDLRIAEITTLAVRGDRLALFHLTRRRRSSEAGGEAEVEFLAVIEVDETGGVVATVIFDVGALDAAYDELDERYLRGE